MSIPASSKQREAAKRYILWATSRDCIEAVASTDGWPAVPPGTRHSTYQPAVPFAASVYQTILETDLAHPTLEPGPYQGIQYVDIPEYSSIGTQVGQKIELPVTGELGIEQVLRQSQSLVREQMRASGYLRTDQEH